MGPLQTPHLAWDPGHGPRGPRPSGPDPGGHGRRTRWGSGGAAPSERGPRPVWSLVSPTSPGTPDPWGIPWRHSHPSRSVPGRDLVPPGSPRDPPWTGSSGRWPADPGRRSRAAYGPAVLLAVAPRLRLPLGQPSPRGHADGRGSGCLVGSRASFADGSLVAVASCGSYSAARDPPAPWPSLREVAAGAPPTPPRV